MTRSERVDPVRIESRRALYTRVSGLGVISGDALASFS